MEKLFSTSDNSYATANLSSNAIRIDTEEGQEGAAHAGRRRHLQRHPRRAASWWSAARCGSANGFLRFNGNRDLFLNMVNWLTSDEDLISIRPKEPENQQLNISGPKMSMLFWLSVVFLPLAVVGSGMVTWWRRR